MKLVLVDDDDKNLKVLIDYLITRIRMGVIIKAKFNVRRFFLSGKKGVLVCSMNF